jgi:hypothetical protein
MSSTPSANSGRAALWHPSQTPDPQPSLAANCSPADTTCVVDDRRVVRRNAVPTHQDSMSDLTSSGREAELEGDSNPSGTRPRRGRPPGPAKLTSEVQKTIIEAVADGVPLKYAAQAAGIGERTVARWKRLGKSPENADYAAFSTALKKAEGEAIARNVRIVKTAAETTWTAAAWWLERRYPGDFGRDSDTITKLKRLVAEMEARRADSPAPSGAPG